MILGLTGSLGSGKSTVAEMLQQLGNGIVIDADELTHRLQEPGAEAHRQILCTFGPGVLLPDGRLDRKKLAAMVFGNEAKRQLLNSIVHPLVRREELRLLEEHKDEPLVILMVPLLFETGMDELADQVAVVTVSESERVKRLEKRSSMDSDEVARRLSAQMDQREKVARADFVIDNSGTLEETLEQVKGLLVKLGPGVAETNLKPQI